MSHYDEEPEYLSNEEVEEIQEEYRKQRLIESLVGPSISTGFHILLIVLLAYLIQDKIKTEVQDIEVTIKPELPIVKIQDPPVDPIIEVPTEITIKDPLSVASPTAEIDDKALEDAEEEEPESSDFDKDMVSDIIVSESAIANPSVIGGKTPGGNKGLMTIHGVDPGAYPAFIKCLQWLAKVQNADGSWGNDAKAGYTS